MNADRSPVLTPALWQEIDLFFMQQGRVYETLSRLKERLAKLGISYAVLGGMALVLHGYRRLTEDVDLNTLIELKLASGLSAPDRLKDLADVQELIRVLQLDRDSASQLDASVREEFLRLWSAVEKARQRDLDWER
ncbi:MAG: hypothetical protein KME17_15655 [Cyanosarcina radialis HA8281-LM2]|jgi:hypothetical protein|nr:hypothetical protein [Cyanosarcina radialis HA8281-LM2]